MSASSASYYNPRRRRNRNYADLRDKRSLFVSETCHAMLDEYQLKALVNEYATEVQKFILFEEGKCYGKIVFKTFPAAKIAVQKLQRCKFKVRYWRKSDEAKSEPTSSQTSCLSEAELIKGKCNTPSLEDPPSYGAVEANRISPKAHLIEPRGFPSKQYVAGVRLVEAKHSPTKSIPPKAKLGEANGFPRISEAVEAKCITKPKARKIPSKGALETKWHVAVEAKCCPPKSKAIAVKIVEEPVHCSKELMGKIQKKVPIPYARVSYDASNGDAALLCSKSPSESQATKKPLEVQYHFKDFIGTNERVPTTDSGHNQENVKSTVACTAKKICIKERIVFKDEAVGCMMIKSSVHSQIRAAGCKGAKLNVLNEPQCYGFLVEGRPMVVKEVIESVMQYYERLMENREKVNYSQIVLGSSYSPVCTVEKVAEWKENLMNNFMVSSSFSLVSDERPDDVTIGQAFLRRSPNHVVTVKIVVGRLSTQKTDAIVIPTGKEMYESAYPVQLPHLCTESFQERSYKYLYSPLQLSYVGNAGALDGGKLPCSYIIHILYPTKYFNFSGSSEDFIKNSLSVASRKRMGSISFPEVSTHIVQSLITSLQSLSHSSTVHTVNIVVGSKQQASLYVEVLKNAVTSNLASKSPAPLACASASEEYVWSWKNDTGVFVPYTEADTDSLNQAYQRNPDAFCDLKIGPFQYRINFKTMMQSNTSSSNEREVTKSPKNTSTQSDVLKDLDDPVLFSSYLPADTAQIESTYQQGDTSEQSVVWKYLDDSSHFSSYLPADSSQIESMYQQRHTSRIITINSRKYSFDFSAMLQVNIFSKFSRMITRNVSSLPGQNKIVRPIFLNNGEVIINLKGPSQNTPKARVFIQDQFGKQLSSKDIPLPSSLPSVLQSNLEALAKKHSLVKCEVIELETIPTQKVLRVEGLDSLVQKAQTELQGVIISHISTCPEQLAANNSSPYPQTWEPMSDNEQYKIVDLSASSKEFSSVHNRFMKTMSGHRVLHIQRVQNKWIWCHYTHTKHRIHKKNNGRVNELQLFHGSRNVTAETICRSEEGFDMRHSREGMWGQANYFAKNAGYSDTYAYHDTVGGYNEMMLALVLTGDSFGTDPDSTLRMPPMKSNPGEKFQMKYDSVTGETNNCKVYMTYCNENAYPAYIIKYNIAACSGDYQRARNTTYARWMQPNTPLVVPQQPPQPHQPRVVPPPPPPTPTPWKKPPPQQQPPPPPTPTPIPWKKTPPQQQPPPPPTPTPTPWKKTPPQQQPPPQPHRTPFSKPDSCTIS